ncbi:hypothetical protein QFZ41_001027 [Luteibacter sp. W1I16]
MPTIVAWKILIRSISSWSTKTTPVGERALDDAGVEFLADVLGQLLGIVQATDRAGWIEDHGSDHHRPGERPASGFVHPGDDQVAGELGGDVTLAWHGRKPSARRA